MAGAAAPGSGVFKFIKPNLRFQASDIQSAALWGVTGATGALWFIQFIGFSKPRKEGRKQVGVMKGGRKNLKRAAEEETVTLQEGQSIVRVVSLRGSNIIEILDARGETAMALFPAKFQKSMWIKRGSFVVVDDSGREQALEKGRKVTCMVSRVLFHDQVRVLKRSPEWPEIFKAALVEDGNPLEDENEVIDNGLLSLEANAKKIGPLESSGDGEESGSDDDELPPLEPNTNRRPLELPSDTESDSGSDS